MPFIRAQANILGWCNLTEVADAPYEGYQFPTISEPLLVLHHLSDLHVCDSQSPVRPEFLDRWSDPDSPIREEVGVLGVYRPHSMLSPHLVESMVQSLNRFPTGPLSGFTVDAAVVTGDTTDNAQQNEVNWYISLLDGGEITPDSGDLSRYEGSCDDSAENYDVKYWHPHGTPTKLPNLPEDDARAKYGFPIVPNLLNSCRKPFKATGLNFPWYSVHGNHDALLQGTVTPTQTTQSAMVSNRRYISLPTGIQLDDVIGKFNEVGPANYPEAGDAQYIEVTADVNRRAVARGEYAELHLASTGLPKGHGFSIENVSNQNMYYSASLGQIKLITLDTVNEYGGWQGSLDEIQFEWLKQEILNSDRFIVIASHHPLMNLFNGYTPIGRRICEIELRELLVNSPKVIAWIAGHNHRHHVEWVGSVKEQTGFWHIETASNIDWPQQSRTIEIVKDNQGDIYIGMTVIDHIAGLEYGSATETIEMAALARLISANVWQKRNSLSAPKDEDSTLGSPAERNMVLRIINRHLPSIGEM